VELFLNNMSLGKKTTNRSTKFMAAWDVPYRQGSLVAVGFDGDKKVNTSILKTAAEPIKVSLSADREQLKADNQDLSYVSIELKDAKGVINPKSENLLRFKLEGPGVIAGVGNANPVSLESDGLPQRKAWRGKCLVIVKSTEKTGEIKLKVSADGLAGSSILLRSK